MSDTPFYIRKLLSPEDHREKVDKMLARGEWVDGLVSFTGTKAVKNNKQLKSFNEDEEANQPYKTLSDLVFAAVDKDRRFREYTIPARSAGFLVSKWEAGSYYKIHHDALKNGDYSTTVFLSNPDDYDGGELVLETLTGDYPIKLGWGEAITYPTGTLHQIKPITFGVRYVAVFWTHTFIRDPLIREVVGTLGNFMEDARREAPHLDLFKVSRAIHTLHRGYGNHMSPMGSLGVEDIHM